MRDAVLVDLELPPRVPEALCFSPRRGAARVRPFPKFAHAPEAFQRSLRVLRADREACCLMAARAVDDEVM